MRWVSSAFYQQLAAGNRDFQCKAVITLANSTVLTVTNANILIGGFEIEDAAASNSNFDALGSAIINAASLSLPNRNSEYSTYVFDGATAVLYVGLTISNSTSYMKLGTYTVEDASYTYTAINLRLLDYMQKFDVAYGNLTLTFPVTLSTLTSALCTKCGVTLNSNSLSGFSMFSHQLPGITFDTTVTTCRDVLHWIGEIVGCFFRCNADGQLEAKWFNRTLLESGNTNNQNLHSITSLASQDIAVDDTVITGVKIIMKSTGASAYTEYLEGSEGYVITIENNELIYENAINAIKSALGTELIGLTFRRMKIDHINDPSIEAGDVAIVTDRDGNTHPILITSTDFKPEGLQTTYCSSQTVGMNSSSRYKQAAKEYADTHALVKTATISNIEVAYRLSPSGTDPSAGTDTWGDTIPTIPEGMYLWTRTVITYNDGQTSTAYSVSKNGESPDKQHFFWDDDGIHITVGNNTANVGKNLLADSNGLYIRNDTNVLASFAADQCQIGADDAPHIDVSDSGISGYNKDAVPFFFIDMEGGISSIADRTMGAGTYFAAERKKIWNTSPISLCSRSIELNDISSGGTIRISKLPLLFSVYEGVDLTGDVVASSGLTYTRTASGYWKIDLSSAATFTVGASDSDLRSIQIKRSNNSYLTIQVVVNYNGDNTISYMLMGATSTGTASSGFTTIELRTINIEITYPVQTKAPIYSFGFRSADDKGAYSAIIGEGLAASSDNQVVIGKYNVDDTNGAYAFIVGNGSGDSSRSNAYAVTWGGDQRIALNTVAASGTLDGNLYAAITALGWESDVIL